MTKIEALTFIIVCGLLTPRSQRRPEEDVGPLSNHKRIGISLDAPLALRCWLDVFIIYLGDHVP